MILGHLFPRVLNPGKESWNKVSGIESEQENRAVMIQHNQRMKKKHIYFFVRGFMRSGTNWVGNLLNRHPDICVAGEYHLHRLHEGFDRISNPRREPHGLLMHPDYRLAATRQFERFVRRLIELGSRKRDKPEAFILGARTPAPLNRTVIRNAKRIHVVRDGRDCLVSLTFHFLRQTGTEYPFESFPTMQKKRQLFQDDPDYFQNHPEQLLDDEDWVKSRTRRWSKRYLDDRRFMDRKPDQVFSTTYEALHCDTETIRHQMYEFLGADPDRANPLDARTTAGFESENVLSHYRKGQVGDWKKYFTSNTSRWFIEESQGALELAGYESDVS